MEFFLHGKVPYYIISRLNDIDVGFSKLKFLGYFTTSKREFIFPFEYYRRLYNIVFYIDSYKNGHFIDIYLYPRIFSFRRYGLYSYCKKYRIKRKNKCISLFEKNIDKVIPMLKNFVEEKVRLYE